jgi:hypothetical protein
MIRPALLFACVLLAACHSPTPPGARPTPPTPPAGPPTPLQCSSATGAALAAGKADPSAWYRSISGPDDQASMAIATDSHGNLVVTGHTVGATDFGAGPVGAIGDQDLFVAKYDPAGALLWAQRFGAGGSTLEPTDIAVDSRDDIVVTGSYWGGAVDLGGARLDATQGRLDTDLFVVELSLDGDTRWAATYGEPSMDSPGKIGVGPDDGVFLAGMDFSSRIVLASYSPDGEVRFQRAFGQVTAETMVAPIDGVRVDAQGDVFLTGASLGGGDFGGGPMTADNDTFSVYVAKYSGDDGSYLWAKSFFGGYFEGTSADGGSLLVVGDDIVIASGGAGATDPGEGALSSCGPQTTAFVARLSGEDGTYRWSRGIDTSRSSTFNLFLDPSGRVVLTGNLEGPSDLGGGVYTESGSFAATYDAVTGAFVSMRPLVEVGTMRVDTENGFWGVGATATDGKGHVFVESSFFETESYGLGTITSQGWGDVLLVRTSL